MPRGGNGNGGVDNGTDDDDVIESTENKINGGDGHDTIVGTDGDDRVNAGDGDDVVTGGLGDDTLYGNDGSNTAVFSGDVRNYSFEDGKGNAFIVSGDDGTDTLKHFDTLMFDNFTVMLDGSNNAALVDDHAMTVSEDGDGSLDLLSGAWDFEGDTLTVTAVSAGNHSGSMFTYDAAGSFDYLAVGESAQVDVTYTVSDGTDTADGVVTVTVEGENDAPETTGGDTDGEVTRVAQSGSGGESGPIVFTVEQYTGFQSNNLQTLIDYAAANEANYTDETDVIDYTDDPGGFAGEIPGSSPWPAAEATGASGTGGINNVFFARITTDFSISVSDTYTFRTFNDDGVFLIIDGQLVISDTGYHPEAPFEGSIALDPGNHTLELFFFENGGEASLELSVRDSSGAYSLLGAADGVAGGVVADLTESGSFSFTDVDLSDTHIVTVAAAGGDYVGSLTATISDAATGDGEGSVAWDFTVDNAALDGLGEGESLVQTYDITVTDNNGASTTETVTITLHGADDPPEDSGGVFDGLGVDPSAAPYVENWIPGGQNGYWTDISDFTSDDDVYALNVNNTVYSWLDDGWGWPPRETGYDFFEGDDVFAVLLGGNGGNGVWSRSGVNMGEGNDTLAMDINGATHAGVDGWHNGAQFEGEGGDDRFLFDVDSEGSAVFSGQRMYMGDGNDMIKLTVDAATGFFGYTNNFVLGAGDDTVDVDINVPDGADNNHFSVVINGQDGNDHISISMSGDSTNDSADGLGMRIYGDAGNDVIELDVFDFSEWNYHIPDNIIDGGDDYDILMLSMGSSSDFTVTDNGDGTHTLDYLGNTVLLSDIEEIQFTDTTLWI